MITDICIHPFCDPALPATFERSTKTELAPDVWFLEGFIGFSFFGAPPCSNIFILRDGDLVFLLDTGMHPYYREKTREVLREYAAHGAKTLVLMNTQGHWDHALNNRVILEAGFPEVRFLLPEPEVPVIASTAHWLGDMHRLEAYYPPYREWLGQIAAFEEHARGFSAYGDEGYTELWQIARSLTADSPPGLFRAALQLLCDRVLYPDFRSMAERAEILSLAGRELRRFGDVEVWGWQVGRFFIIHDGGHSPGHVALYDPRYGILLGGDTTIEINPPFFDSHWGRTIAAVTNLRRMAEQGFIELATDSHRSKTWFAELAAFAGIEPLHPLQFADAARGRDECVAFYRTFEDFYIELRDETLAAHARLGEATIPEIAAALFASDKRAVAFKKHLPFPSRPEVLVTHVMRESGAGRRKAGDRILFTPRETWSFAGRS